MKQGTSAQESHKLQQYFTMLKQNQYKKHWGDVNIFLRYITRDWNCSHEKKGENIKKPYHTHVLSAIEFSHTKQKTLHRLMHQTAFMHQPENNWAFVY